MDKGISFYFGFISNIDKRAQKIKEVGFDCVIANADKKFNYQNGPISKQVKVIKKAGLKLSSLHMRYNREELPNFWKEGRKGERLKKILIKDVKVAHKYGFKCVVVHLVGEYSKVGEKRLLEVLDVCERLNVPLAIENLGHRPLFIEVFKNIKHKMLKFNLDVGHNNCYDKDFDYIKNYGDKLMSLHLSDNNGERDEHTLTCFSGNIDWDKIAKQLANYEDISLDYEIFYKKEYNISEDEYLRLAIAQAKALEEKIEFYKKKNS